MAGHGGKPNLNFKFKSERTGKYVILMLMSIWPFPYMSKPTKEPTRNLLSEITKAKHFAGISKCVSKHNTVIAFRVLIPGLK